MGIESLLKKIDMKELNLDENRYQYNGVSVPRTTEIISSMIHEDSLMVWANNIGLYQNKKYKLELEKAANKGTYVHEAIEDFISNNKDLNMDIIPEEFKKDVNFAYESFKLWWSKICKHNLKVIMQEQKLVCPWFGGTLDLLLDIDGRVYLLDFKTSNHLSYKYFLQLSSYRYILRNYYGIDIYGCGTVRLSKTSIEFEEEIIDRSNPNYDIYMNNCECTFLSLVYSYYNKIQIQSQYNNIFRKE